MELTFKITACHWGKEKSLSPGNGVRHPRMKQQRNEVINSTARV